MTFDLGETFFAGVINWGLRGELDLVVEFDLIVELVSVCTVFSFWRFVFSF